VATPGFLRPITKVGPRPDPATQPGLAKYVRSYLVMRLGIGALGIVLPLWLVLADWLAFSGDPHPRGSLSVYYYSGMRKVFVMIMSATGIFLITHEVADRNLDNTATFFAGLCAILIALFPTGLWVPRIPFRLQVSHFGLSGQSFGRAHPWVGPVGGRLRCRAFPPCAGRPSL
jgi:hypothetical protein